MVIFFVIEALKNMIQLIKRKRPRHKKVVEKDTLSKRIISYEEQYDKVSIEGNSLKHQPSVAEGEINRLEYQVRSKDEEIRRLKYELALKEEETQHLKSQLDLREKEFERLRIAIQSACTDLGNAVTTADNAFIFRNKRPPLEKGIEKLFTEKDLSGAELSGSGRR